jgi:hypothetical protein
LTGRWSATAGCEVRYDADNEGSEGGDAGAYDGKVHFESCQVDYWTDVECGIVWVAGEHDEGVNPDT